MLLTTFGTTLTIRHEPHTQRQSFTSQTVRIPSYCNFHFTWIFSEVSHRLLFRVNMYNQHGCLWRHFLYDISHLLGAESFLRNKRALNKKLRNISAFYGYQSFIDVRINLLTFWRRIFFLILAHPVFKMWVIQKPNKVALWNKRHFEEKKMEIIQHV